MLTLRNATEHDIAQIQELAEKTWWPSYGPILAKEQIEYMLGTIYSRETMLGMILDKSQTFLLIYEDSVPCGFASYGEWNEHPLVWKIHKLYVLPEKHGKGLGRKMIEEIAARAREHSVRTLVLNVNRHNPALTFYKKYGFRVLREEDIPIGPYWMNDFVMELPLNH
jgi:diamine N-acetyltransferase